MVNRIVMDCDGASPPADPQNTMSNAAQHEVVRFDVKGFTMMKLLFRPTRKRLISLLAIVMVVTAWQCWPEQTVAVKGVDMVPEIVIGEIVNDVSDDARQQLIDLAETDHIALLERCLENTSQYHDYTLTFVKQERLKGKLKDAQKIAVSHRAAPFSVGMTWLENAPRGDRVLYVEGQRDNQMLIRPTKEFHRFLAGEQVLRDTDSKEVMEGTLKPITVFGFKNSLEKLIEIYKLADERGELETTYEGVAMFGDREVLVLNRFLPERDEYEGQKTVIYIDCEYLVPVMVAGYDWSDDAKLVAQYVFTDIKFNMDLTDADFVPSEFDMSEP
jgi:hypothetical protein